MQNSKQPNLTIDELTKGKAKDTPKYIQDSNVVLSIMQKDSEKKWNGEENKFRDKFVSSNSNAMSTPSKPVNGDEKGIKRKFETVKHVLQDNQLNSWKKFRYMVKQKASEQPKEIITIPKVSNENDTSLKNETIIQESITKKEIPIPEVKQIIADTTTQIKPPPIPDGGIVKPENVTDQSKENIDEKKLLKEIDNKEVKLKPNSSVEVPAGGRLYAITEQEKSDFGKLLDILEVWDTSGTIKSGRAYFNTLKGIPDSYTKLQKEIVELFKRQNK
jgi:hypothetical protein